MRLLCAPLIGLMFLTAVPAEPGGKDKDKEKDKDVTRFDIVSDYERYPQNKPQAALGSVIKALDERKIDYLFAHLADPAFVAARLKIYKAGLPAALAEESKDKVAFQRLTKAAADDFRDDPSKLKELARFAKDGEWEVGDDIAQARLKSLPARKVFLKKIDNLWYLLDRDK
jgi:hypothetical protein